MKKLNLVVISALLAATTAQAAPAKVLFSCANGRGVVTALQLFETEEGTFLRFQSEYSYYKGNYPVLRTENEIHSTGNGGGGPFPEYAVKLTKEANGNYLVVFSAGFLGSAEFAAKSCR